MMDKDNFSYLLEGFNVVMTDGVLAINDSEYENNDDDPTYTFAREIAKARGLITN